MMHVTLVLLLTDAPSSTHNYTDGLLAVFTGLLVLVGFLQWFLIRNQDKHLGLHACTADMC